MTKNQNVGVVAEHQNTQPITNMDFKRLFVFDRRNNLLRLDNVFYTEDKMLVFTLYVTNIPDTIDSDELKEYFSKFGEVENVVYKKNYKTAAGENRVASIVRFVKSESASNALKLIVHKIDKIRLIVRAADSWIQPHKIRLSQTKIHNSDNLLFKLNDYCLLNILKYLPFSDQVRISLLSDRFRKILLSFYQNRKILEIDCNVGLLTLLEIKETFMLIGKLIDKLSINCNIVKFNRIYDFLMKHFPNLKSLDIINLPESYKVNCKEMQQAFKKLTHLGMINCYVTDELTKKFTKLTKLESLDLTNNTKINGKYLYKLVNLKNLNIKSCTQITATALRKLLETIQLKSLNVFGIEAIDLDVMYVRLVEITAHLEEYELSTFKLNNDKIGILGIFQNLKRIRLSFSQIEQNDRGLKIFLENCVAHKANTLEYLGLIGKEMHLSEELILAIASLKQLKELEIVMLRDNDGLFWTHLNQLNELKLLTFEYPMDDFDESRFLLWLKKSTNIERIQATFTTHVIKLEFILLLIDELRQKSIVNKQKIFLKIFYMPNMLNGINTSSISMEPKYIQNQSLIELVDKTPIEIVENYDDANLFLDDDEQQKDPKSLDGKKKKKKQSKSAKLAFDLEFNFTYDLDMINRLSDELAALDDVDWNDPDNLESIADTYGDYDYFGD